MPEGFNPELLLQVGEGAEPLPLALGPVPGWSHITVPFDHLSPDALSKLQSLLFTLKCGSTGVHAYVLVDNFRFVAEASRG